MDVIHSIERCRVARLMAPRMVTKGASKAPLKMLLATTMMMMMMMMMEENLLVRNLSYSTVLYLNTVTYSTVQLYSTVSLSYCNLLSMKGLFICCIAVVLQLLVVVGLHRLEQIVRRSDQRRVSSVVSASSSAATWSNRWGSTLTPVSSGVWAAERPFMWNNIDVGGRSVVVRMIDGTLLVHSPVEWTKELNESINALSGPITHIVSPNYEHVKYASQWAGAYPQAVVCGCPGLRSKEPKIVIQKELPGDLNDGSLSSTALRLSFDVLHFDCEVNPFTGRPFFNEVVLYHIASKTLIVADAFWNYPSGASPNFKLEMELEGTYAQHVCSKAPITLSYSPAVEQSIPDVEVPIGTTLWKFGMDRVYKPFYSRFMVGKGNRRLQYMAAVDRLLAWDVEVIAPCHGDVIRGKRTCRKALLDFFA